MNILLWIVGGAFACFCIYAVIVLPSMINAMNLIYAPPPLPPEPPGYEE